MFEQPEEVTSHNARLVREASAFADGFFLGFVVSLALVALPVALI